MLGFWRTAPLMLLLLSPSLSLIVSPSLVGTLRGSRCAVTRRGGPVLRMAEPNRAGNATDVPQTFRLRGLRPKGVGDEIENIPQGPTSEEYEEEGPEWLDPAMFSQYDTAESSRNATSRPPPQSVGGKIGLEKQLGIPEEAGSFGMASRQPMSGSDRIRADEERLLGASQESSFLAAIAGTVLVGAIYFSLSGGLSLPQYGAGAGGGQVVERFEEAFVCYGIPSPDDPSGCKDSRSVGRVRVLSPVIANPQGESDGPAAEPAPASQ